MRGWSVQTTSGASCSGLGVASKGTASNQRAEGKWDWVFVCPSPSLQCCLRQGLSRNQRAQGLSRPPHNSLLQSPVTVASRLPFLYSHRLRHPDIHCDFPTFCLHRPTQHTPQIIHLECDVLFLPGPWRRHPQMTVVTFEVGQGKGANTSPLIFNMISFHL